MVHLIPYAGFERSNLLGRQYSLQRMRSKCASGDAEACENGPQQGKYSTHQMA